MPMDLMLCCFVNNLRAYLEPKTETLKKIFNEGQDQGITRLEITIYTNYIKNDLKYYEDIIKEYDSEICQAPIYFKTPIKPMESINRKHK